MFIGFSIILNREMAGVVSNPSKPAILKPKPKLPRQTSTMRAFTTEDSDVFAGEHRLGFIYHLAKHSFTLSILIVSAVHIM